MKTERNEGKSEEYIHRKTGSIRSLTGVERQAYQLYLK